MPLNTVTLTWDLTDLIQAGQAGVITLVPTALLTDSTDHIVVGQVAKSAGFVGGTGSLAGIIATDDSQLSPAGWAYQITIRLGNGQVVYSQTAFIAFANGATQDLATLSIAENAATYQAFMPLPSGGPPSAGEVPLAVGDGSENSAWGAGGGGGGGVASVTAADTSIVIGGTGSNPTVRTGTLDVIAADHPPAAAVAMNSKKITGVANGTASSDAAAFGQIPTALPPNGAAGGDLSGTYPNPSVAKVNGVTVTGTPAAGNVLTATSGTAADWAPALGFRAVTITTTGSTFSPKVALAPGSSATVSWVCPGVTSATGLNPTLSFGSSGTRTVYMTVSDTNGFDAIAQVILFNIGFNHNDDNGISSLDSSYDYPSQAVSGLFGVNNMTGLQIFCAADINTGNAGTNLTGTIDFTGMSQLQHIECFDSALTAVYTGGCLSLIRCCVEENNLTSYNLNSVEPNLLDLRMAAQAGGAMTFTPLAIPAKQQWHLCIRDQIVTNPPDLSLFPAVQQCWIWNTRQSGLLKLWSTALQWLAAHSNDWTSADLANQFGAAASAGGATPTLDLGACLLTSLNLTGCTNLIDAYLNDNAFSQATVDSILATFDANGQNNGILHLAGNASPSSNTHVTNLTGRGWTVTTGPGSIAVVQSKSASGTAAVSFNSTPTSGNTIIYIVGGYNSSGGSMSTSAPKLNNATVSGSFATFNNGGTNGINSGAVNGSSAYICAWVLPNVPAANSLSLTTTGFSAVTGAVALEVSGLGASPTAPLAISGVGGGTVVDAGFAGELPASQAIVVGLAQIFAGASAGPASPWTVIEANTPTWAGYRFQSISRGYAFRWLQTASSTNEPWAAGLVGIV